MPKHVMIMPMRYDIKAGRTRFLDDGTPIWELKYIEWHDEEGYYKAKEGSVEALKNLGLDAVFNDEDFSVSYEVQGPRDKITSMLASEFLGRSPFGNLTFNDLMAGILHQLSKQGVDLVNQGEAGHA